MKRMYEIEDSVINSVDGDVEEAYTVYVIEGIPYEGTKEFITKSSALAYIKKYYREHNLVPKNTLHIKTLYKENN